MYYLNFFYKKILNYILRKNIEKNLLFPGLAIFNNDYVCREILINGLYEKNECIFIKNKLIKKRFKNKVFIDIGAHVGNHSLFYSKYFKKILSFEPNRSTFDLLKLNTKSYSNIKIFNIGISNKREKKNLFYNSFNMGGGSFDKKNFSIFEEKRKFVQKNINLNKLDNLLKNFNEKIGFIKIDIEGFEKKALEGMKKILDRHSPIIIMEIENRYIKESELIHLMKQLKYFYLYEITDKYIFPFNFFNKNLKLKRINNLKKKYYSTVVCSKKNIL